MGKKLKRQNATVKGLEMEEGADNFYIPLAREEEFEDEENKPDAKKPKKKELIIFIFHWQEKKNLKTKKINPMPKNQRRRVTNLEKKKTKKINPMPKNQRRRVTNSEKKKTKK